MQREYNLTYTTAQKQTFQHITLDYHHFKTDDGHTEINKVLGSFWSVWTMNRLQIFVVLEQWTFTGAYNFQKAFVLLQRQQPHLKNVTSDCICPSHIGRPVHHLSRGLHLKLNQDIHLFLFPYSQGQCRAATKPDGENEGGNWEKGDKEPKLTLCRCPFPWRLRQTAARDTIWFQPNLKIMSALKQCRHNQSKSAPPVL